MLGHGGMGVVYKARQKTLDRIVALKILLPRTKDDPAFAERFSREARALAKLNHPNIVAVYDFGEMRGRYYFIMEYVDGINLRQAMREGRFSQEEALAIVPKICDALQYAHEEGVVHRDIKPENILIDRRGRLKIADFGLAKLVNPGSKDFTLTGVRDIMGTPHYMAPEQFEKPATVDHRADIFALGVVFYEMLTGELPLGRFQPPSQRVHIDVRLDEVVLRTLERDPQRRYQNAGDVKTDVEGITSSGPGKTKQEAPAHPATPPPGADSKPEMTPDEIESARHTLLVPGIGLLVAGILDILCAILIFQFGGSLIKNLNTLLGWSLPFTKNPEIPALFSLVFGIVLIRGGLGLFQLRNQRRAFSACIWAMIPMHPAFLLGFPIGLIGVQYLSRPKIKGAFARGFEDTVGDYMDNVHGRLHSRFQSPRQPASSLPPLPLEEIEKVRAAVLFPAMLFIICGVLDVLYFFKPDMLDFGMNNILAHLQWLPFHHLRFLPVGSLIVGIVLVNGGKKLLSLTSHRKTIATCIWAMLPIHVAWPLGMLAGLIGVALLSQARIVRAFGNAPDDNASMKTTPAPLSSGDRLINLIRLLLLGVVFLVLIAIGGVLVWIIVPALSHSNDGQSHEWIVAHSKATVPQIEKAPPSSHKASTKTVPIANNPSNRNLITNGGFEDGLTSSGEILGWTNNWTTNSKEMASWLSKTSPAEGSTCLKIRSSDAYAGGFVRKVQQTVAIQTSATLVFSGFIKGFATAGVLTEEVNGTERTVWSPPAHNNPAWKEFREVIHLDSGAKALVSLAVDGSQEGSFDGISLRELDTDTGSGMPNTN